AVTSFGPSPPAMTWACSSVGANFLPTAAAISAGEKLGVDISSHLSFSLHRANGFQWAAITLGADPGGYPRASYFLQQRRQRRCELCQLLIFFPCLFCCANFLRIHARIYQGRAIAFFSLLRGNYPGETVNLAQFTVGKHQLIGH